MQDTVLHDDAPCLDNPNIAVNTMNYPTTKESPR